MVLADQWVFAPFRLDPSNGCLWRGHDLIPLRPKPFAVLAYLVAHAGQVVRKEALLDAGWPETVVSEGVLKTCMAQIRQALGEAAREPQYIATVHRRGYRFIAQVKSVAVVGETSASESRLSLTGPALPVTSFFHSRRAIMVGREVELVQLQAHFDRACRGERQIVCLTGEVGIGKTTLIDTLVAQIASTTEVWVGRGQCIEHYGAGEPYLPLLEALGRLGCEPGGDRLVEVLRQQAPSWLVHLPLCVSMEEYEALQLQSSGIPQHRMLRELAQALETLTRVHPLILVLEDLHWSDVSTVAWLAYVARRREMARLLVLGTYRPVETIVQAHPVRQVMQELQLQGQGLEFHLSYLSETAVVAYLTQRFASGSFPQALASGLHQRTRGNPLFLIRVLEDAVQQGRLRQGVGGWELPDGPDTVFADVPETLRQLMERQLERLPPEDRELLEVASVAGTEFSAATVAAGLSQSTEDVEQRCVALARQEQFIHIQGTAEWPNGTVTECYAFVHALYQETFYARVSASRRVRLHHLVSQCLEAGYGAQTYLIAAELATHCVRGREVWRAVPYLHAAGEQALQRGAHQEAVMYFTHGLELLHTRPDDTECTRQEMGLHMALASGLIVTKGLGAHEVREAYDRAHELCQHIGSTSQRFPVLYGLWTYYMQQEEAQTSHQLADQLLVHAENQHDPALLVKAHRAQVSTWYWRGEFTQTRAHAERGMVQGDLYHEHRSLAIEGSDPMVLCLSIGAWALWYLGYPDQALQQSQTVLAVAREIAHPHTMARAFTLVSWLHLYRREGHVAYDLADKAITLATTHDFPHWVAMGTMMRGWALAELGQWEAGIEQMRQGMHSYWETGAMLSRGCWRAQVAEAYGQVGRPEEGLHELAEVLVLVHKTGIRHYEAEMHRLRGELLLQILTPDTSQAETCFYHALDMACHQQAKSLELRAATSLARLWQSQDKRQDAYDLLSPVYEWFSEGFDTADLQEAKQLLDELSAEKMPPTA